MTTLTPRGPKPLVVSHFESNEELFEACVASASLPMVTQKGVGSDFKGTRGFDGLFTDNVPVFTDGRRPQLIFDLGKVQYALSAIIRPNDPCIEALAVSGALQTARFLDGRRGDPKTGVCSWKGWDGPAYPHHRRLRYALSLWSQSARHAARSWPRPPTLPTLPTLPEKWEWPAQWRMPRQRPDEREPEPVAV